jgi:hypothetical protein
MGGSLFEICLFGGFFNFQLKYNLKWLQNMPANFQNPTSIGWKVREI